MTIIRSIKRNIARKNMKEAGITQFCKHSYISAGFSGGVTRIPSEFSEKWKDYLKGDK